MDEFDRNQSDEEDMEQSETSVDPSKSPNYFDTHMSAFNGDYHTLLKGTRFEEEESLLEADEVGKDQHAEGNEEDDVVEVPLQEELTPFVPPTQRADAPLASIINPQLEMIDPRLFFTDYKPSEILRFSRLFAANIKSSSRADIWWLAKTFQKHKPKQTGQSGSGQSEPGEDKSESPSLKRIKLQIAPTPAQDQLGVDQHALFLSASSELDASQLRQGAKEDDSYENMTAPWRNGPAKIWYDRMNVPQSSEKVDYGFKINSTNPKCFASAFQKLNLDRAKEKDPDLPDIESEDLLPVNLLRWEDNIIFDGEDVREQVVDELKSGKMPSCGWVPTQYTRTYEQYMFATKSGAFEQMFERRAGMAPINIMPDPNILLEPTSSHSMFPPENNDVLNYEWEKDIIWDAENMPYLPEPRVLALDFDDEPLIYGMPADRKDDFDQMMGAGGKIDRKEQQFTKKSKMILGQVQQRQKQEAEEQMENNQQLTDKDAFNLSNDDYYIPKNVAKAATTNNSSLIQHSIPALNIHRTFFPTHLTPFKLRHWHRLPISKRVLRYIGGLNKFHNVHILTQHIKKMEEQREKIKQADGGGDFFFMRDVNDLSGKDGQLAIVEYSEEHPPLLSQPGMASRVKNYYKRKTGKDVEPEFELGEMAFSHNVPFLGQLHPGQALQSIENLLYRAPIYAHQPKETDFLLVRCKGSWYIRKCPSLYLAGQQCPLIEVPSPNSKRATIFVRDFLLAFIFRLFWASEHTPRRLKMEDIKNAFPHYAESSVRKRLKQCSEFKRLGTGPDQNYWVLKPDYRLPSKEEVLVMVTPEMCCAQYSMIAAEQRLKDAGYGEKYFFTPENEDDSDDQITIEDEIKCAPWSTTRCFIAAMRGKCLLDSTGIADPTGCGQGFSYVRVTQKPQRDEASTMPKRLVTGTNADLRKLPLKEAKEICREYGVKEEEISALSRWEIIDVIRTLSTQAAKAKANSSDTELSGMARFARGNIKYNMADMQEKYKKHCQHIFELQNQSLANPEELSTDEGSSADDSDNDDMVNKLEDMLQAHRGKAVIPKSEKARLEFETEERERERLKKIMHGDATKSSIDKTKETTAEERKNVSKIGEDLAASASKIAGLRANEKLKIHRTIKNEDGTSSTRVEVVTRPQLIEAYKRIRLTKDETFIHVYAQMDEQYKEEKRKEKRRLQDQLRRIKRNEQRVKSAQNKPEKEKKPEFVKPNLLKMRCSACHGTGHMKTNRNCPLFGKAPLPSPQKDNQSEDDASRDMGELSSVEGTKLTISKKLLKAQKASEKPYSASPVLDVDESSQASGASSGGGRSRSEPFEDDITEADLLASIKSAWASKQAAAASSSSASQPSAGPSGSSARRRLSKDVDEDYLAGPAKSVHRMRADPRVTMGTMLMDIMNELKALPGAEHHLMPVNARLVPDYYQIIKEPMDLNRIKEKVAKNDYELRKDFLLDVKKMLDNSRVYNGDNSVITEAAKQIFELAGKRLLEKDETFMKLEKAINPLLDDNDAVGFSYILTDIIQKCKNVPKSAAFHIKVDPKKMPQYYKKIVRPMDLGTIEELAKQKKYKTVQQFRADIEQIVENSRQFNGPMSPYTLKAQEILDLASSLLGQKQEQLAELEANINGYKRSSAGGSTMFERIPEEELEQIPEQMDEQPEPTADYVEQGAEDEEEIEGDVDLKDELALSGDDEDEEEMEWDSSMLLASSMQAQGQIVNDLALSDSDEEHHLDQIKRPEDENDDLDTF